MWVETLSFFSLSLCLSLSDPPGCGRPHRAAGDIRPVSAPRRAVSPCACWSPPLPHHLATASHRLFDGFASAAVPLHGVNTNLLFIQSDTFTAKKCSWEAKMHQAKAHISCFHMSYFFFSCCRALYWSVLPEQTSHAEQEEEYLGLWEFYRYMYCNKGI